MKEMEKEGKKETGAKRSKRRIDERGEVCVGPPIFFLLFLFHPREERIMRADRIAVAAP